MRSCQQRPSRPPPPWSRLSALRAAGGQSQAESAALTTLARDLPVYAGYVAEARSDYGLGYPVTDESGTPDHVGRFNHFEGGSIYWTPQTGAHEVHGAIRALWASLGWERSGLPPTPYVAGTWGPAGAFAPAVNPAPPIRGYLIAPGQAGSA